MNTSTKHTIDARNKRLGRVASEVAACLMGKRDPSFARNTVADVEVHVVNASRLLLPDKKKVGKIYVSYSGYPGGRKETNLKRLLTTRGPEEVVRRAVYGMLPDNKLRSRVLKRLIVTA